MSVISIRCRNGQVVRLEGDFYIALHYAQSLKERTWDKDTEQWRTPLPATIVARNAPRTLDVTIQEPLIPLIFVPTSWQKGEWE